MSIIGTWKCNSIMVESDGAQEWAARQDIINAMDENEFNEKFRYSVLNASLIFCEDGYMRTVFPLPEDADEEELKSYEAAGQIYNNMYMPSEAVAWKEEDGKLFVCFDDGAATELKLLDNGLLELAICRYEKI